MFDDIPEDKEPSYPCPECENGRVTQMGFDWTCDTCPFFVEVEADDDLDVLDPT